MKSKSARQEEIDKSYIDIRNMSETKKSKLLHYCHKEPRNFEQFDVFTGCRPNKHDGLNWSDKDGDQAISGLTTELISGSTVKVLIEPRTPMKDALRALDKIKEVIGKNYNDPICQDVPSIQIKGVIFAIRVSWVKEPKQPPPRWQRLTRKHATTKDEHERR